MTVCRTHLQEREGQRESLAERFGGCVPKWERKKQQALSRRTEEMSISNVPQPIFPIKKDSPGNN